MLITLSFLGFANAEEKLIFNTTDDYPYQTEDGRGATYEIMNHLISEYYPDNQIIFKPWKRAFNETKFGKRNYVLFSMKQKPERMSMFDWCCYLYDGPANELFALKKNNLSTNRLATLSGKEVGLWRGDSSELVINDLIDKRVEIRKFTINSILQGIKMLLLGRLDFLVTRGPLFLDTCKENKLDCNQIEKIKHPPIEARGKVFIAFSKNSDKKTRDKFTSLFKEFRKTDKYQAIVKKWGLTYIGDN